VVFLCRGKLKVSHTDGSPKCIAPTFDADCLENEAWTKIMDILNNPDKLAEVIKDSLEKLNARQAELDSIINPIDEKLDQIIDKKAKLADECLRCGYEWVPRTMYTKYCTSCHSPYWDRPKLKSSGQSNRLKYHFKFI
jgi:hypothetical protein